MKLFGFEISKKVAIIAGIAIVGVAAFSGISANKAAKEKAARLAAIEAERLKAKETKEPLDREAQLQAQLEKKYGKPPEGFKWNRRGELEALSDDTLSAEDVVYTFLRSLSILDFSTAQRYSDDSKVAETYQKYYGEVTKDRTNYYKAFLRKQYKLCLETLEINDVADTAVFADGTEMVTINISAIDLTDKDFWKKDKDEIYSQMRVFDETESDNVKKEQYLYDYIYNCYEDGTVAKTEHTVELVLTKENGKGWLVSNDSEVNAIISYEKGVNVAEYIEEGFDKWLAKTQREEAREAAKREREAQKKANKIKNKK